MFLWKQRFSGTMLFFIVFLMNLAMYANAEDTSTYTTRYDGVDLDEILTNDRLLNGYINCLMELGPCTPDGKELKANLPDAIENDCQKCTKRQRDGADQVMHYIIEHRTDDWTKLEEKYNADGSYKKKYLARKIDGEHKSKEEEENDDTNTKKSSEEIQ